MPVLYYVVGNRRDVMRPAPGAVDLPALADPRLFAKLPVMRLDANSILFEGFLRKRIGPLSFFEGFLKDLIQKDGWLQTTRALGSAH